MAEKISSIMATEVALDVTPATRSLKALKQSVSIVNKAVMAQSANLAASGDAYEAARSKASGLNDVISRQREIIARLEETQRRQVDMARNQSQAMADLREKIKQTKAARDEEAESAGRDSDRYKELSEQIRIYKSSLRDAGNIDQRLRTTTNQLASAKSKLARYTAEQRQANTEMRRLSPSPWRHIGDAVLAANRHIQNTRQSVGGLRGVFVGTFAGNALVSGAQAAWGAIKEGIGGAINAGISFDKQQQVMQASWDTLMNSSSKAENMRKSIIDMSNALGQPVELTDELSQQFYHVFDNQQETEELTRSFLTMGDAIGLSSDRLQQVGMDFTHMLSSSKLQLGDLNQITDAFPMFGNALLNYERQIQHNGSLTMADLRKQISAGKIQSKDAEVVMNQLGQKYKQSSENLMSTLPGMARQIKAKVKQLSGDVMNPILQQQSPIYKTVSNWVKDPNTDTEFKQLGSKVNKGMQTVMMAFGGGGNPTTITNALNRGVQILGNTVTTVANWIARNAQTIKASFNLIVAAGRAGFAVLGAAIHAVIAMLNVFTGGAQKSGSQSRSTAAQLNNLANSLNRLSQNRSRVQMLGRALASIFLISKATKFARAIGGIGSSITGPLVGAVSRGVTAFRNGSGAVGIFSAALKMGPWGLAAIAIGAIAVALIALYKHSQKFRDFMHGLWVITKTVAKDIIKTWPAYWMIKGLQKLYKESPAFRSFVNGMAKIVREVFGTLFKWLKDALGAIWKGLKWVYDKVADIGRSGSIKNPSKKYASGTTGSNGEFAVVNDAQSQHYREMLAYKGMLIPFSKKRNQIAYIPQGAQVIDGEASHKLAKQYNLPHYASGTSGASQLNSLISGLNDYGNGNRQQVAKKFLVELTKKFNDQLAKFQQQIQKANQEAQQAIEKTRKELAQKLAEYRQRLAQSMAETNKQLHQSESEASKQLGQQTREARQERMQVLADHKGHSQEDIKAVEKEQQKYAKSMNSAYKVFWKSINSARSSAEKSAQTAHASFSKSTATARNSADSAIKKAQQHQSHVVNLANQNISQLKQWRQSNISQLRSGMAEFAQGGIADRPSIFGEAGLEAAIPLDQMKAGNAWQTLAKVVSYYAGNTDNVNQPTNRSSNDSQTDAVLAGKLDTLIGLMEQFVSGQADQINATKHITGYDSNRAFNDFSSNFRSAQAGNLTY